MQLSYTLTHEINETLSLQTALGVAVWTFTVSVAIKCLHILLSTDSSLIYVFLASDHFNKEH